MKKLLILLLTSTLALTAGSIKDISDIRAMVEESKTFLPRNMNSKMIFMELNLKEDEKALEYLITFTSLDKIQLGMAQMEDFITDALKSQVCTKETAKEVFRLGFSMRYLYYDRFGDFFHGEDVTEEFCRK